MRGNLTPNRRAVILSMVLVFELFLITSSRATNSYYSMQHPNWPPMPAPWLDLNTYWLSNNVYAVDDTEVDYNALRASNSSGEVESSNGLQSFGPDDLWIEITSVDSTNQTANLTLHGTIEGDHYQLLSKTNLIQPGEWKLGQIIVGDPSTNQTDFGPHFVGTNSDMFFKAHHANLTVGIQANLDAIEPNSTNSDPGQVGRFFVFNSGISDDVTVYYQIGGVAQNGVDYTNLSGVITVPANPGVAEIDVQAIEDSLPEFEESVTLTLIQTNTYLIDPASASASITINDNFGTNIFTVVTNLNAPIGIDYYEPSNSLIVSFDFNAFGGPPTNFARIYLSGPNLEVGGWSSVSHVLDEVKLATVKKTANGFTNGEIYFGNDNVVGRVSADGAVANLTWCTLTKGIVTNPLLLRGSLYADQTGLFSNEVIVVTSDDSYQVDSKGVWRVDSQARPTLLANVSTRHLEGVITLTNDATRWGPWAGKIVTGDEFDQSIFTIDTNGVVTKYFTTNIFPQGIQPEDFEIIPPNQDLYACDPSFGQIMKLSRGLLADYAGDLLIAQAGEFAQEAELFIVHWDGTEFVVRRIPYGRSGGQFEHVTFAPINLPSSPQ